MFRWAISLWWQVFIKRIANSEQKSGKSMTKKNFDM